MVVADEVDQHIMMEADKSKIERIINMSTTILDAPRARGVKAAPKTSKQRPKRNVGIVAGKATGRVSVGRSTPIEQIQIRQSQTWKSPAFALRQRVGRAQPL